MNDPQVVITRKDKKIHKFWHALGFTLTGGASAPLTAAKAASNATYNARTRRLAERSGQSQLSESQSAFMAREIREIPAELKELTRDELTELATMPDGRIYNYWIHGIQMKGLQRIRLNMLMRELRKRTYDEENYMNPDSHEDS